MVAATEGLWSQGGVDQIASRLCDLHSSATLSRELVKSFVIWGEFFKSFKVFWAAPLQL